MNENVIRIALRAASAHLQNLAQTSPDPHKALFELGPELRAWVLKTADEVLDLNVKNVEQQFQDKIDELGSYKIALAEYALIAPEPVEPPAPTDGSEKVIGHIAPKVDAPADAPIVPISDGN